MTRKVASGPVRLEQCRGHVRWRDDNTGKIVHVHQLLVIAQGADPEQVFSKGEWETHHGSGIRFDNRPSNVAVMNREEHASESRNGGDHHGYPGEKNWHELPKIA